LSGPFQQTTEFEFLESIGDRSHQQITTDPRRLRAAQSPPFLAQSPAVEVVQAIQASPQKSRARWRTFWIRTDRRRAAARRPMLSVHFAAPPRASIR
jgi:hypothetical protein